MYMLQLFDEADAIQPVDARLLREGMIRIGRDAASDWPIADPDCQVSRTHCEIAVNGDDGLVLTVLGANGAFDDLSGERLPDAVPVPLALPSAVRLGRFRLVATHALHSDIEVEGAGTVLLRPPLGASTDVPSDWADAAGETGPGDGSLLEAFCRGAGLDCSQLAGEEPAEIMARLGAVYRQMVLGIGDLMTERNRARAQYQLTRTTISGANNNPFKWAPNQRLAVDLLLAETSSFLSGPAALNASFRDIKQHLVASFAGLRASLEAAVDSFDPAALDEAAGARGSLLKSRAALQAEEAARRHADLRRQLDDGQPGPLDRAFVAAYDAAIRDAK